MTLNYKQALYQKALAHFLLHNDILMILGKGHEDYQITKTGKHHFSDQEEVMKYITKQGTL